MLDPPPPKGTTMRGNANDIFTPHGPWVKAGSQVTVTIGRNVGAEPLSVLDWENFQSKTQAYLEPLLKPSEVFGPFTAVSTWTGEDGVTQTEDSAVVILLTQYTTEAKHVNAVLSALAAEYGQEAIAWSYGPNHLAV